MSEVNMKGEHREIEVTKHLDRIEHREKGLTPEEGDHIVQHDKTRYDFDPEILEVKYDDMIKTTVVSFTRASLFSGVIFIGCIFIGKVLPLILV